MIVRKNFGAMLLLFACLFVGSAVFAQESRTISADKLNNNWVAYFSESGLSVSIKEERCDVGAKDLFTYAQLRFENTTSQDITVEFVFELQHENGCVGCGKIDEYQKVITIPAGTTLEGDSSFALPELSLLINNPYQTELGAIQSIKAAKLTIL